MSGEQAEVPAAQCGTYKADGSCVRRDRVLAHGERQTPSDGHAQAVPQASGHTQGVAGERLQHKLFQRVQVYTETQDGEGAQAKGRVCETVLRARRGVRVRLGRGQAAHRRQAGDLHDGCVRPVPQRGTVGVPVPPPGQPSLHGVAPQLLPRRARGAPT